MKNINMTAALSQKLNLCNSIEVASVQTLNRYVAIKAGLCLSCFPTAFLLYSTLV